MNARALALLLIFFLLQAGQAASYGQAQKAETCPMKCCQRLAATVPNACGCLSDGGDRTPAPLAPITLPTQSRELLPLFLSTPISWNVNPMYREAVPSRACGFTRQKTVSSPVSLTVLHCAFLT